MSVSVTKIIRASLGSTTETLDHETQTLHSDVVIGKPKELTGYQSQYDSAKSTFPYRSKRIAPLLDRFGVNR